MQQLSFYNYEGYADPTAYEAIKNLKENKIMSETKYLKGDVIDISTINGPTSKKGVVIQAFGSYVTFLNLLPERPKENPYSVCLDDGEIFWMDLGKPCFTYKDNILGYYDKIDKESFEKLLRNMALCLGITASFEANPNPKPAAEPAASLDAEVIAQAEKANAEVNRLEKELVRMTAKCEVFEGLYKELLLRR